MTWHLFLLFASACLIHDIQTAPKSIALGMKEDFSSGSSSPGDDLNWLVTPCDQCQNLALAVRMAPNSLSFVEKICRTEQQFCSQIRGKEAEFVNTVLESKKGNKEDLTTFQVCTNYSACDPSEEGKEWWKPKSFGACEQCQSSINGLTHKLPDELPYGRLEYYTMEADLMKIGCGDVDFRQFSSEFCTLFEGRELEFVKSVMDCTGVKFMDDKVLPNCTVTGQIVDPESRKQHPERKVCESFVDSCKIYESMSTCDLCVLTLSGLINLPDEVPYERQYFYAGFTDSLKEICLQSNNDLESKFCAMIAGKESEIVKALMDCSGVKFKDDKVQPNCTLSGSSDHRVRMTKVCERFVESCNVDQFTRSTEVSEV